MGADRKKPSVGFWALVALVVVLVAYPLSIGPVEGLRHRKMRDDGVKPCAIWDTTDSFYAPLGWIYMHVPKPIREAMDWYGDFWH